MQITLPSGTNAVIEKPISKQNKLGLVVIPDVMGLRPLFYDMVKHLATEWDVTVCSFELYPGLEHFGVEERLGAASQSYGGAECTGPHRYLRFSRLFFMALHSVERKSKHVSAQLLLCY